MDVRSLQRPLKDRYRQDPASSLITLTAHGAQTDGPIACSVDLGREIYKAQAHKGVGGAGTGACSGDLLLGAVSRLRADHLPNGSGGHGNTYRRHRCHGRGRPGSARNARHIERSTRRISEHQSHFRRPRNACNCGAVKRVTGKNGTVLRGNANTAASADD